MYCNTHAVTYQRLICSGAHRERVGERFRGILLGDSRDKSRTSKGVTDGDSIGLAFLAL